MWPVAIGDYYYRQATESTERTRSQNHWKESLERLPGSTILPTLE